MLSNAFGLLVVRRNKTSIGSHFDFANVTLHNIVLQKHFTCQLRTVTIDAASTTHCAVAVFLGVAHLIKQGFRSGPFTTGDGESFISPAPRPIGRG